MKDKTNIRYIGFRSANEGGRLFDFCISGGARPEFLTCFEIPAKFFNGVGRVRLQEGVGICYAKLKDLMEVSSQTDLPSRLCLTAADLAQYREVAPSASRRRANPEGARPDWQENKD